MEHSTVGRLISVLFAPQKTFRAIADRPSWVLAWLVAATMPALLNFVAFGKIDAVAMLTAQLDKQGQSLSADQIETMASVTAWTAPLGAFVATLAITALMALLLWLVLKVVGGEFSFRSSMAVVVHAGMANVVGMALRTVVAATKDTLSIDDLQNNQLLLSNLGFLAGDDASAFVKGLLGAIDVFSIWSMVLLVIGYVALGKMSRNAVTVVVVALWLVATLGGVALGAMGQ